MTCSILFCLSNIIWLHYTVIVFLVKISKKRRASAAFAGEEEGHSDRDRDEDRDREGVKSPKGSDDEDTAQEGRTRRRGPGKRKSIASLSSSSSSSAALSGVGGKTHIGWLSYSKTHFFLPPSNYNFTFIFSVIILFLLSSLFFQIFFLWKIIHITSL